MQEAYACRGIGLLIGFEQIVQLTHFYLKRGANTMVLTMERGGKLQVTRLVIKDPMINGCYAIVETRQGKIKLTAARDHKLMVDVTTLPASLQQRLEVLHQRTVNRMVARHKFDYKTDPSDELVRAFTERSVPNPFSCGFIALRMTLLIKLGKPHRDPKDIDLGTITKITIYNKGQAPLVVEH